MRDPQSSDPMKEISTLDEIQILPDTAARRQSSARPCKNIDVFANHQKNSRQRTIYNLHSFRMQDSVLSIPSIFYHEIIKKKSRQFALS